MPRIQLEGEDQNAQLFEQLYGTLKRIAATKMQSEREDHTLQATALVHEAFAKLDPMRNDWKDPDHFTAAASEAMRRILVDHARRKNRQKRGGGEALTEFRESQMVAPPEDEKLLQVHEALEELSASDSRKAEVVKLRFFVGLKHAEIASLLGVNEKTVRRDWDLAKAILFQTIKGEGVDNEPPQGSKDF